MDAPQANIKAISSLEKNLNQFQFENEEID